MENNQSNFIDVLLISDNMTPGDADFLLSLLDTNIINYISKATIESYRDKLQFLADFLEIHNSYIDKDYLLKLKMHLSDSINNLNTSIKSKRKILTSINSFLSLNLNIFNDTEKLDYSDLDKKYCHIFLSHLIDITDNLSRIDTKDIDPTSKNPNIYSEIYDPFVEWIANTLRDILKLQSHYYKDRYLITFKFDIFLSTYKTFISTLHDANHIDDYQSYVNELSLLIETLVKLSKPYYNHNRILSTYCNIATMMTKNTSNQVLIDDINKKINSNISSIELKAKDIIRNSQVLKDISQSYDCKEIVYDDNDNIRRIKSFKNTDESKDYFIGNFTDEDINKIKKYLFPILFNTKDKSSLEDFIHSCLKGTEYASYNVIISNFDMKAIFSGNIVDYKNIFTYQHIPPYVAAITQWINFEKVNDKIYLLFNLNNQYIGKFNIEPNDDGEYEIIITKINYTPEYITIEI